MTTKTEKPQIINEKLADTLEDEDWSDDPLEDSLEEMYESNKKGNVLCDQINKIKSPELRSMFAKLIASRCSDQALCNFLIDCCDLKLKILDDDGNVVSESRAIDKMLKFLGTKATNASALRLQLQQGFKMPKKSTSRAAYAGEPNF